MTVQELINRLAEFPGDLEVRLADWALTDRFPETVTHAWYYDPAKYRSLEPPHVVLDIAPEEETEPMVCAFCGGTGLREGKLCPCHPDYLVERARQIKEWKAEWTPLIPRP